MHCCVTRLQAGKMSLQQQLQRSMETSGAYRFPRIHQRRQPAIRVPWGLFCNREVFNVTEGRIRREGNPMTLEEEKSPAPQWFRPRPVKGTVSHWVRHTLAASLSKSVHARRPHSNSAHAHGRSA